MPNFDIRPYSPPLPPTAPRRTPAETQALVEEAQRKITLLKVRKGKKTARPSKTRLQRLLPQIEAYLRGYMEHAGFAPNLREIGEAFNTSSSQAWAAINLLIAAGTLVRAPNTARGIQFADQLVPVDPDAKFYDVIVLTSEGPARLNTEPLPLDVAHGLVNGSLERLTYHRHNVILYTTEGDWMPVTARRHDGTLIAEYSVVEVVSQVAR